jgi:hypothetical protein
VFVVYISRDGHPPGMKNPLNPLDECAGGADVAAERANAHRERPASWIIYWIQFQVTYAHSRRRCWQCDKLLAISNDLK